MCVHVVDIDGGLSTDLRIPLMWKETDYFKHKGGISRTFIYAFLLCRIFLTCIWFIYMLNFNISVCVYMSSDCIDLLQITAVSPSSVSCDTEHKSTTRHSWKRSIHARRTSPSMTSSTCKAQRGSHTVESCVYRIHYIDMYMYMLMQ